MITPKSVAIVGMGLSHSKYTVAAAVVGNRKRLADETWGICTIGGILRVDRIFMMDNPFLFTQKFRDSLAWLREIDTPIYTSTVTEKERAFYPNYVEYPLEEIINKFDCKYFTNTVPYAIAYAIYIGVKELKLFGLDFSYTDRNWAEQGRSCTEFWLGIAKAHGVDISVAEGSTLLGTTGERNFYGYAEKIVTERRKDGSVKVSKR